MEPRGDSRAGWRRDLLFTLLATLAWLWFAAQYGFRNSPDSWYRGVLAKSILEGHPYFINLRQGWLYDYPTWHHSAAHEPLLPVLYALGFAVAGTKIVVANLVSAASAGLLLLPLLRLSRILTAAAAAGVAAYVAVVLNVRVGFLFEVTSGLSLPTSALLLAASLLALHQVVACEDRRWVGAGAVLLAAGYLTRAESQLVFFWTMAGCLVAARLMLPRAARRRLLWTWCWSTLLVLPWLLRKLLLFGHPFFTHMTPMLWTERAYDYWTYPEGRPFPSAAGYFESHTAGDFLQATVVEGVRRYYLRFDEAVVGPLWLYFALTLLSALLVLWRVGGGAKRFTFVLCLILLVGTLGVLIPVPILDARYFIPAVLLMTLTIAVGLATACDSIVPASRSRVRGALRLSLVFAALSLQGDFFAKRSDYFPLSYESPETGIGQDLLVRALKRRFPEPEKASPILGPFAQVQRLAFATGLPFVEPPDNLGTLRDLQAFFRRYDIRYSVVDVGPLLPPEAIVEREPLGDRVLFTLGRSGESSRPRATGLARRKDPEIRQAILDGRRRRALFVDARQGSDQVPVELLRDLGVDVSVHGEGVVDARRELYGSGGLLLKYRAGLGPLSAEELRVMETFVANGGAVFVLCPAWVWVSYERRPLEELPYHALLRPFDVVLSTDYEGAPFDLVHPFFGPEARLSVTDATASRIVYGANSEPIAVGNARRAIAVASRLDGARAVVWGHDFPLDARLAGDQRNEDLLRRTFDWLFSAAPERSDP